MKRKRQKMSGFMLTVLIAANILNGCQEAPEATEEGGVLHVKSDTESQVEAVLEEEQDTPKTEETAGSQVDCVLGTEENGIKISAELPKIPGNVYEMTLTRNEEPDKDMLTAFLDSDSDTIQDKSEEVRAELEEAEKQNSQSEDAPPFFHDK